MIANFYKDLMTERISEEKYSANILKGKIFSTYL
jgi:hypothetical protein